MADQNEADDEAETETETIANDPTELTDAELENWLLEELTVPELRPFCARNNIQRTRGANKAETAQQAVEQNREAVEDLFNARVNDEEQVHVACCPSCDFENEYDEPESARRGAQGHHNANEDHGVKAWHADGRRLFPTDE